MLSAFLLWGLLAGTAAVTQDLMVVLVLQLH